MTNTQLCDVFLDSEFWQALGKSLGWNRKTIGPFWMNGTGGGENYIDEHYSDYLKTQEGTNLPVKHCIFNTDGIEINTDIMRAISEKADGYRVYHKSTFGSLEMANVFYDYARTEEVDSIEFVGLCTDICVISNALIMKTFLPQVEIVVDASCCAGVTPESHKAALTVMKSCQIKVINEY